MNSFEAGRSRVLVIEDSPADRSIYRRTLCDFDVEFAGTGEEGLDRIADRKFDVVVLDYELPGMNGDAVLATIRGGPSPDLPVVVVTGSGNEHVAVDLLRGGASDYLTKDDLHTHRVSSAVRGALDRHRLDQARLRAEDELRQQNRELESAIRKLREAQARMIQSEKMASLGQLVAGVAHEINNPLSYATNNLAVLDRDVRHVAELMALYRGHLGDAVPLAIREAEERVDLPYTLGNLDRLFLSTRRGLARVGEIVSGLRDFSRVDQQGRKAVDLNESVRVTADMVRYQVRHEEIHLVIEAGRVPTIWCEPGQINQVLLNLIMNAIQAVGPGATITVRTRSLPESGEIQFEVSDDGPGIPAAIRSRIFDPFFTTKPTGVGTGLGLWICYDVVEQHGGRIDLVTEPGQGATFTVTLPVRRPGDPT